MATVINGIREFSGKPEEDAIVWLRDALLITSLVNYSENEILRILILKMREAALSWASETFQNHNGLLSLEEFTTLFKKRFNNLYKTEISLSQFLTAQPPNSREEFSSLLNTGTRLFEQKLMNTTALVQVLIGKCPDNIKGLLFQAMEQCADWTSFIQRAEQVAWLAFPDKVLNHVSSSHPSNNQKFARKRFCELHGEGYHDSKFCKTLQLIKAKGWYKEKKVINSQSKKPNAEEPPKDPEINQSFVYSQSSFLVSNPFFTFVEINGLRTKCLLDSGADVSIIHADCVPQNTKKRPSSGSVVSACGTHLSISEVALDLKIKVMGETISFSPFITTREPRYAILGADVLLKHPQLLVSILLKPKKVNMISTLDNKSESLIKKFDDIFKDKLTSETVCKDFEHIIDTGDAKPIYCRPGRILVNFQEQINADIEKNLNAGIIRESKSPWNSRLIPVTKPDGSLRLCVDYRPLNSVTVKDKYPLPRIDEILDTLNSAQVFSTLDATSGYYQLAMREKDKCKTAFSWKNGHYEYNRMPFGLCNAPATFQKAMDTVLRSELDVFVLAYLDDVIIFSKSNEDHFKHLEIILTRLKEAGLVLNKKKCKFFAKKLRF